MPNKELSPVKAGESKTETAAPALVKEAASETEVKVVVKETETKEVETKTDGKGSAQHLIFRINVGANLFDRLSVWVRLRRGR